LAGNLKSPGERLQEVREARGLSLADLAQETKIPEKLLAALEQDEYPRLSGELYVKSFLQTYARALELDPREVLEPYYRRVDAAGKTPRPEPPVLEQDLGPQEIKPPRQVAKTIAKPPLGEEAAGGDVWHEEVQVRRIGLTGGVKLVFWLGFLLAAVIVILLLFGRGWFGGEAETEPSVPAAGPTALADSVPPGPAGAADSPGQPSHEAETTTGAQPGGAAGLSLPEPALRPPLPAALPGDASTVFAGGRRYSLVLRLLCREPVGASVRWVGRSDSLPARWPEGEALPLPDEGIVAGHAYAVREGLVVYWGTEDHFYLRLESAAGVQVDLNGKRQEVRSSVIGREWLLDATVAGGER